MLSDPLKRSQFHTVVLSFHLFLLCCIALQTCVASAEDSVSNLKRQFVKLYLRAERGDADAQYAVGMMYYSGQEVPQDSRLASLWFSKAAKQGQSDAQYFLSLMYGLGQGVTESDTTAAAWCQKAAQQGHAEAQYSLARMYSTGQGLPRDDGQAVEWLRRAAEQDHADAQCDLGLMYKSGRGVKTDINQAVQWWVKASQQGHTWSRLLLQENMGSDFVPAAQDMAEEAINEEDQLLSGIEQDLGLLEHPEPVQKSPQTPKTRQDMTKAIDPVTSRNIERSSNDLDSNKVNTPPTEVADKEPAAIISIPEPIEETISVPLTRDPQSLPTEDPSAQYDLAVMYYDGEGDVQDYAKALKLFTAAAEQGHAEAQYKLGVMYSFGQGVTHDPAVAVQWFRKAAQQDLPAAQYCLGVMYGTGQGIPQDLTAAVQWYLRAAEQGSVAAQFMLGIVYSKGQGVIRDSAAAVQWYTRAAEQGSPSAQYVLAVIYDKGQGLMLQDDQEALKWYTRAAERGHADAQYDLAVKYMNGQGVEKDFVKAYRWCLLAALNDKDVTRFEKWLESRMTAVQLEIARQLARKTLEQGPR